MLPLLTDLEKRWEEGDLAAPLAVELARKAYPQWQPAFLAAPPGFRLRCHLIDDDAVRAGRLLSQIYWNEGIPLEEMVRAHRHSTAWVGLEDANGELVGSARAISDTAKWAYIYDVMLIDRLRKQRLGEPLFELLLNHPALRRCRTVRLDTKDAENFYLKFAFVRTELGPQRPWRSINLSLYRKPLPHAQPSL